MKQQIINKLSKFSIIGMGENSHFVNYPTKYRLELFKQLCYQSNFNIIWSVHAIIKRVYDQTILKGLQRITVYW